MILSILEKLQGTNSIAVILLSLGIILFSGYLFSKLTNFLHLPKVSGYIIAGILIGPSALNLIPTSIISNLDFVSDIALAFIAFNVGKYFKKDTLKKAGAKVIWITLFESLLAGIFIFITMYFCFSFSLPFSLILAAIATSTAPASTMMTIRQYHAKGEFVDILLQVVALDDVICLLAFSICIAIGGSVGGTIQPMTILLPIIYNIAFIIGGAICGFILSKVLSNHGKDSRLIITVTFMLLISGLCSLCDISPLLSCMIMSAVFVNCSKDKDIFSQMDSFTPPIMCLFFVKSGLSLNLTSLKTVGIAGVVYFIVRIIGKLFGSYLGCWICKTQKTTRKYLGLALIPQAGVSIGLAFLGQRLLNDTAGNQLLTIILASSVLYELIGPACAKLSLHLSKSIETPKIEPVVFKYPESSAIHTSPTEQEDTEIDEKQPPIPIRRVLSPKATTTANIANSYPKNKI